MRTEPTLENLFDPNFGVPPKEQNVLLQNLGSPHIRSFNFMSSEGIHMAVKNLYPIEFKLPTDELVKVWFDSCELNTPLVPHTTAGVTRHYMLPAECRQRQLTYSAKFHVRLGWSVNGINQYPFDKDMGDIPIMLKSNKCHLDLLTPQQLVEAGEHEQEWGGYFVVKGIERLVRMLLLTRRNYPMAIKRSSWKGRGTLFSDIGITMRCVKQDQTAVTNNLHFVLNGTAKFMFTYKKRLYYAPLVLILKCLCEHPDKYIYQRLLNGFEDDLYYSSCVQNMLRLTHLEDLHTQEECKAYLGKILRPKFNELPEWYTDYQITDFIMDSCILIHLNKAEEKFDQLIFMTQKLFSFAQNKCLIESPDAVMMQELLLGGHLYLQILKERMEQWLVNLKFAIMKKATASPNFSLDQQEIINCARLAGSCGNILESFLSTGNVLSPSGLGLMQDKGLTIIPENINRMRYMSHFKAVHRGSFFQEMRTTEARQLLPDAWGFICPVHTPDGAPCGLLNHLSMNCTITEPLGKQSTEKIPQILVELGMVPLKNMNTDFKNSYVTQLDGRVIGYVHKDEVVQLVNKLRMMKIKGEVVPKTLEICLVPIKKHMGQFPGLFLFTSAARMMRPLINLAANDIELVGTFEQVYMEVCIKPEEIYKGITTHMELSKTSFLSNLASLIPMPDYNQSPRNMYQCQMGKQTMGTPCHNYDLQAENKLYRLQTPATPLFRPVHYDNIGLDDFAMGTNAIVAVISYTGYDMEDAMIINKSSDERGFAHGSIYKSEFLEMKNVTSYFCRDPSKEETDFLDTDGLPYVGRKMSEGEPYYCYYDTDECTYIHKKFKGKEECYVNSVRRCGHFRTKAALVRNANIGDKFASRAGQKGICSQKWPSEDLPFTESGLVPDIVFNPHGFPSRMTIAMMIELMAGKSASLHGLVHDATPFKFSEDDTAIDYFGRLLEAGGYNYYGTETMYSGIDGREMTAQIFFGVVHYQRLRHMVSDKWQVRATGAMDAVTNQPIKGRKKGGGVRFGEMERDSLISHGSSFLLQDRLFHHSDKTTVSICINCQSLLGPFTIVTRAADKPNLSDTKESCRFCGPKSAVSQIHIPYIYKYFVTQLASCNINVRLMCKHV